MKKENRLVAYVQSVLLGSQAFSRQGMDILICMIVLNIYLPELFFNEKSKNTFLI